MVSLLGEAGVTSFTPDLPSKYYEVATRRSLQCDEPLEAIARARQHCWSANFLERYLEGQREKSQNRRRVSLTKASERIRKMIEAWSVLDQQQAVSMLRNLATRSRARWGRCRQ